MDLNHLIAESRCELRDPFHFFVHLFNFGFEIVELFEFDDHLFKVKLFFDALLASVEFIFELFEAFWTTALETTRTHGVHEPKPAAFDASDILSWFTFTVATDIACVIEIVVFFHDLVLFLILYPGANTEQDGR